MVDVDRWGGVNVVRAVQALRGVVGVTAGFPVETLDRLVVVGRALGAGPLSVLWAVVDRAPDVGWVELVDEAAGELVFGLDRRARRGLAEWDGTGDDVAAIMIVVSCEAAARAFTPLVGPELLNLLHIPWRAATVV